jgi:predicted DNA-binding transcriptional regulator AlpA
METTSQVELLTLSETEDLLKISPAGLWLLRRKDPRFPRPYAFGPKTIRFSRREVLEWVEGCRLPS